MDKTKMEVVTDDKLKIYRIMTSLVDTVENIVGEGKTACWQHFLVFPQCFPNPSSLGSL